MRRTGRRQTNDYLEENEELNITQTEELYEDEYEEYDESDEGADDTISEEEKSGTALIWKKIGKVALIILALIALFFVSMKVTEICLDRNQEPDSYGTDAPAYSDSDDKENTPDVSVVEEESDEDKEEVKEENKVEDEKEKTSEAKKPSTSETEEPKESEKVEEPKESEKAEEPKESEKTEEPEKSESPSVPSEPEEPVAPEKSEQPSTPETPSTPSKPIITPGNPAA